MRCQFRDGKIPALTLFAALFVACATLPGSNEEGFVSLFDGQSLKGWTLVAPKGAGYGVTNGVLYCAKGGGGNLLSEREYADFILRLDFKLDPGANNGIAIRAPLAGGSLAYTGIELQILDDDASPRYARLRPAQYHGSVYDIWPAARGALRKAGQWNSQEITVIGRRIQIVLNGRRILDANLNEVRDVNTLLKHPGMLRDKGHIGLLGHDDHVEFRRIRIKEIARANLNNIPPEGFVRIFNGENLDGWKGLLAPPNDNPTNRVRLTSQALAAAQAAADRRMRASWKAVNGELVFDGKGDSLVTSGNHADYELLLDWKIEPKGDSGIYLRGNPQVQIWDPREGGTNAVVGSGGLYNNKLHPSTPLKRADRMTGEWNRFRILMLGDRVHVFLNDELVVNNTPLENYWQPGEPLPATGSIELQNHGTTLRFRNLYLREISRE
jgi:hypothetical protein